MRTADLTRRRRGSPADARFGEDDRRRPEDTLRATCPPLADRVGPLAGRLPPGDGSRSALRGPLEEPLEAALPVAVDDRAGAVARRLAEQLDADATVSVDVAPGGFPKRYARRVLDRLLVAVADRAGQKERAREIGRPRPADVGETKRFPEIGPMAAGERRSSR